MLLTTVNSQAMEFASSFNAEQGEESVQRINSGCHCGATDHGSFIFKQILRDHGRDGLGWARQCEKFSIKEAKLTAKAVYYLACKTLGVIPHNLQSTNARSRNNSRDLSLAKIDDFPVYLIVLFSSPRRFTPWTFKLGSHC